MIQAKKILWILNKYCLDSYIQEKGYIKFLREIQSRALEENVQLVYLRFETINLKHELDVIYPDYNDLEDVNLGSIESNYSFTFKEALYPDLVQLNTRSDFEVSESQYNQELVKAKERFIWLEKFLKENSMDLVFFDNSPEYEFFFATLICKENKIRAIRAVDGGFFGRTFFREAYIRGNEEIRVCELGVGRSEGDLGLLSSILNYATAKKQPYDNNFNLPIPRTPSLERVKKALRSFILYFDLLKKSVFYSSLPSKFVFFGPHLPREGTVHLNGMPFSNQDSLIRVIARILPVDTKLVVREHPYWHREFKWRTLAYWNSIPNVRIASPKLSIHSILEKADFVLTINSTTGLEALYYDKKVLTFSQTFYSKLQNVHYVDNLFDLPRFITLDPSTSRDELVEFTKSMVLNSVSCTFDSYSFQDLSAVDKRVDEILRVLNSLIG